MSQQTGDGNKGGVVFRCCRAGTTARANKLPQIVPNSSSLYTLFYSVIYNSVVQIYYAISQAVLYSSNFNFKTVIKFVFSLAFQFLFQTVLLQKLANDPKIGRKERKKSKKRWRMEQSRRRKNQSLILPQVRGPRETKYIGAC